MVDPDALRYLRIAQADLVEAQRMGSLHLRPRRLDGLAEGIGYRCKRVRADCRSFFLCGSDPIRRYCRDHLSRLAALAGHRGLTTQASPERLDMTHPCLASHQSMPAPQGLPNNIMYPTQCMRLAHSRRMPQAGDDERSKDRDVRSRISC